MGSRWIGVCLLTSACYSASFEPCRVRCSASEACPMGLTCDEGRCNAPGEVPCAVLLDGGGPDGGAGDGRGATDAAAGAVRCGGSDCAECCVAGASATCDTAFCDAYGTLYRCDGPEDCTGGEVCCLDWFAATASCAASTGCPAPGKYELCHDSAECGGASCVTDGSDFYLVCAPGPRAACAGAICQGSACCAGPDAPPSCQLPCPSDTTSYYCDGPEDCPGEACCLDEIGGFSDCVADCTSGSLRPMCHGDADCEGAGGSSCLQDDSGAFAACF